MPDHKAFIEAHTAPLPVPSVPEIRLWQAQAVTSIWEMTEADLEREQLPPPFWAFPWAGGQALARYLLDHPDTVRGRTVVDIASGSGLVAIAAALAGAVQVTANDIDPYSAAAIALNANLNGVDIAIETGDLLSAVPRPADVYLAGDIAYEKGMSAAMLSFFRRAAAQGSSVLIGDPHRSYFPEGLRRMADYDIVTVADIEDSGIKAATVWALEQAR
ncbi:class I SAM-dependent methyltransferase [Asticcacaulis solisilvae]|uniref:class I SAM-dependent methyltransferase n=1 Tax=Asticcacaulis solisilvae TaxID=1217274 RepID=UPI003FD7813A